MVDELAQVPPVMHRERSVVASKELHIQQSDGLARCAAVVTSWRLPTETEPHVNMKAFTQPPEMAAADARAKATAAAAAAASAPSNGNTPILSNFCTPTSTVN